MLLQIKKKKKKTLWKKVQFIGLALLQIIEEPRKMITRFFSNYI